MIRRVIDGRIDSTTGYRMIGRTEIEKDHAIYAVHCLRRRTSPRPYWIPLAAVDQNYKAEQRFGTSVRDSSPRYPLLPPRPRPFSRSTRSVSIDLPNAFDPVSLPFAPPPLSVSCSASFLAGRHREFRETIGSTDSAGSGGAYRVSYSPYTLSAVFHSKRMACLALRFFCALLPAGGLGDASKTCSSFTFVASRE